MSASRKDPVENNLTCPKPRPTWASPTPGLPPWVSPWCIWLISIRSNLVVHVVLLRLRCCLDACCRKMVCHKSHMQHCSVVLFTLLILERKLQRMVILFVVFLTRSRWYDRSSSSFYLQSSSDSVTLTLLHVVSCRLRAHCLPASILHHRMYWSLYNTAPVGDEVSESNFSQQKAHSH